MLDEMATLNVRPGDEPRLSRTTESATRDALTGLYDRDALLGGLKRVLSQGAGAVSVIQVDLDYFRLFNDRKGDRAGDGVLVRVSAILRDSIPSGAFVAREGGEEFCVVLPHRDCAWALAMADHLRRRIEQEFEPEGITASFGVATFPQHGRGPHMLLSAAEGALHVSKRSGRNRVCKAAG